jgi:hypothetical protein
MSARVISLNPNGTAVSSAGRSAAELLNNYKRLSLNSLSPCNLQSIRRSLRHQKGDSTLVQDMKALVVRRIACEALSRAHLKIYRAFDELLGSFPPAFMQEYMIPKTHELGEAQAYIETCRPAPDDTNIVLRAKREGLLFNLNNLIRETFVEFKGKVSPRFKRGEFTECFAWIWRMLEEFKPPHLQPELAELIGVHVLEPPLPFNITLPE